MLNGVTLRKATVSLIDRIHMTLRSPNPNIAAFTLFEVALSLIIVTFGVVTVLLVIPAGIKVQQASRMSLLASAKAMELVETFSGRIGGERMAEFETPEPWETRPFCYSNTRWDMECRNSRFDGGIMPLPLAIAKRLDSDGDEIQNLLASGAYLYYADPKVLPGVDPRFVNNEAPNEAMKLIFAVTGYAQNNAIPVFPWKAWPYRAAYPSPPMYSLHWQNEQMMPKPPLAWNSWYKSEEPWDPYWNSWEGWCNGTADPLSPTVRDPLMNDIFQKNMQYYATLRGTDLSLAERTTTANPTIKPVRDALVNAVIAYCKNKLLVADYGTYWSPLETVNYRDLSKQFNDNFRARCRAAEVLPGVSYDSARADLRAKLALRVQCMRFMAFVAGTFYLKRNGEAEPNLSLFTLDGKKLSADRLRYFHDCCKSSAMLYAASFPYDWGAPRPITRCIMTDSPLIEFDLFQSRSRPLAGTNPGIFAEMWKPVSAQTITSIGLPAFFPGVLQYAGTTATWDVSKSPFIPKDTRGVGQPLWGDASRFTLTRPFEAAERCRQLVFWSVDWQSYEDAETAPGAPLDASRVFYKGMNLDSLNKSDERLNLGPWDFSLNQVYDMIHLRNPERNLQFTSDMSGVRTGTDFADLVAFPKEQNPIHGLRDLGADIGIGNVNVTVGAYGADRNHNYILDRGILPRSVRQRAQTIGRFQFYDPRIPVTIR